MVTATHRTDRSEHRWMLYALDQTTGKIRWERTAAQGQPLEQAAHQVDLRQRIAGHRRPHRRGVVWIAGPLCLRRQRRPPLDGRSRPRRHGRVRHPVIEWGPASSPIIWNGLVIVQCDTQADSFLLALDAATGATVWKTERDELPSWGTPTIVDTSMGPEFITNASNFVRGYDPKTGKELWRLGRSSKITAPTPIFANGLHIIASGRAPERPVFAVKPGARGDLTLGQDESAMREVVVEQDRPRLVYADAARLSRAGLRAGEQRCARCL